MKIQVWLVGVCALVFLGCGVPEDDPGIGSVGQAVGETCGDSIVGPAETCDDGNATAGDGCSDTCIIEAGHVCRTPGSTCRTTVCSVDAVGGETFAQMNFIEIGVGTGAFFGTTGNSPAGYHARPSAGATNPDILGYVADPGDTDWTDYDGDFFVPGTPLEGWGLEVGGVAFNNNRNGPVVNMPGTFGASACVSAGLCGGQGGATIEWETTAPVAGVQVHTKYTLPEAGAFILAEITLTNTTGGDLTDVYYMRNVDPDNNQPLGDGFATRNSIVSQPAGPVTLAHVEAKQTVADGASKESSLSLLADDDRARVTHGGFNNQDPSDIWNGVGLNTSGEVLGDKAISIAFKVDLLAGASTSFKYAYNLEASAEAATQCAGDNDGDEEPDEIDPDDDNDGVCDDGTAVPGVCIAGPDSQPFNSTICGVDSDADACDDCASGTLDPANDGTDTNGDGICAATDTDDDDDTVLNDDDTDPADPFACQDLDGDSCDDCAVVGAPTPADDGTDSDGDGICDVGDADDDGDGVADGDDSAPTDPNICRDADADGCDDCISGTDDPANDGTDSDGDGTCDAGDADDDNDGVDDGDDSAPFDGNVCRDADADGCDDCTSGTDDPANDGTDSDGDGVCDAGDTDNDNDGVADVDDSAPLDANVCRDVDADGCDDCTSGTDAPANDGTDTDADGVCDAGDQDDDGDGVPDGADSAPLNPNLCGDVDADGCEDCISGTNAPENDGTDSDGDGICDAGDTDDDGDGVADGDDSAPFDGNVCRDADADSCDDCTSGTDDPANDGTDSDGDGACDVGDADDDNDGVADGDDSAPSDSNVCRDADADGCDDCTSGTDAPANDGPDNDGDGTCDAGDADDDNDGVADGDDSAPNDANVCRDADADGCDDCVSGTDAPANDGPDNDGDGSCDAGDADDDNDGVADGDDSAPTDGNVCRDADADSCDDCVSGTDAPANDGPDSDGDGICDAGDDDDDNDGVADSEDSNPDDANRCRDADADGCDDCSSGTDAPANDGTDTDSDGTCDAGDADDDGDGVDDAADSEPLNANVCRDADADSCDDCTSGTDAPANDGTDTDSDGACDVGDADDDGDGVDDGDDSAPLDRNQCSDTDADGCDDCVNGSVDPANDGLDTDGDGTCNASDADDDGDGVADADDSAPTDAHLCRDVDADSCDDCSTGTDNPSQDGIDFDGDGACDDGDDDDDNDGVEDSEDEDPNDASSCVDSDNDGCDDCSVSSVEGGDPDDDGPDADGDGICDAGQDADGDGVPDVDDVDDDNDGIADSNENVLGLDPDGDADSDGILNYLDADDRGDGQENDCDDADPEDGTCDSLSELFDADQDGKANHLDLDSDGDGISDLTESQSGAADEDLDGMVDGDVGDNGLLDSLESTPDAGDQNYDAADTDGDDAFDFLDLDSDGDGISDAMEFGTGDEPRDTDGDGKADYVDLDSDGDGIEDSLEVGDNPQVPIDTDRDGTPDYLDTDADNDGIEDGDDNCRIVENSDQGDADADAVGDACTDDDDGDGVTDADDNCSGTANDGQGDIDNDGIGDSCDSDSDGDGLEDTLTLSGGGCSTAGGSSGLLSGLFLLLGLVALRRRGRGLAAMAALGALLSVPAGASAQGQVDKDYSVERFEVATHQGGVLGVDSGSAGEVGRYVLGLWMGFANDPLVVRDGATGERIGSLVSSRLGGSLHGAATVWENLSVAISVPVVLSQDGELDMSTGSIASLGVGDIRLSGKYQVLKARDFGANVALVAAVSAPTASSADFMGESTQTFTPGVAASRIFGDVQVAANLGFLIRPNADAANLEVGNEVQVRLGAEYDLEGVTGLPLRSQLAMQFAASTRGTSTGTYGEVLGGASYRVWGPVATYAAAGVGFLDAFGTPDWRVLSGLRYEFQPEAKQALPRVYEVAEIEPEPMPEPVVAEPEPVVAEPEPEPVVAVVTPEPVPEPVVVVAEPEPVPEPEPTIVTAEVASSFTFEPVYFGANKNVISASSEATLNHALDLLKKHSNLVIRVEGHTDSDGQAAYNEKLSKRRAVWVVEFFTNRGIAADRLEPAGCGPHFPIADNSMDSGKQINRRVELVATTEHGRSLCK